jgi:hypothetical protein
MDEAQLRAIERVAARLLKEADVGDYLPTPLDDILQKVGLVEPTESVLAPEVVANAPARLRAILGKLAGRVRGLVDRREREVHLDPTISFDARRRFVKGHEIMHHALPWQQDLVYADNDERLSQSANVEMELEASQGSAELLYQGPRFTRDAADLQVGMAAVVDLHQRYGVSLESGLWRYVAKNAEPMLAVVLDASPLSRTPVLFKRHQIVPSQTFVERFGYQHWPSKLAIDQFPFLAEAAAACAGGTAMAGEWVHGDLAGQAVKLRTECLATPYRVLILIWVPSRKPLRRRVKLVA